MPRKKPLVARENDVVTMETDKLTKSIDTTIMDKTDRQTNNLSETTKDPELIALKNQIIKGWPSQRSKCSKNLIEYWSYCDELSILDRLILKGTWIVIPNQCKDELLVQLHEGHFGINCTKLKARDSVY